ncbi:MAG: methyl-accepting chemotaxis protein, partial [SAR324 cluster bacterium]|nr:methyl-accepting chemotaxis protein [SAR324 cluster bacterium]
QLDNYFSEQRSDLQVLSKTVESFQKAADDKLSAIMESKKVTLLDYLNSVRSHVLDFAKRPKIIEAMWDLPQYFPSYIVENRWNEEDLRQRREELQSYWEDEFGERYRQLNDGKDPEIEKYFSQLDDYTIALQYSYIANNPNPMGFKDELDKPDETAYSRLHEKLHPSIRSFLREFGYYDIFLVETEEGRIVYSTFKELNFGTSLIDGPFAESSLGRIFQQANSAELPGQFFIEDFAPYWPGFEAPAAFVAAPIFEMTRSGLTKLGVAIFQFPVDKFKSVMSDRSGLGQTGETYLVGSDLRFRSDSFLDPLNFSMEVSFREFLELDTAPVRSGLGGESGVGVSRNYLNEYVLSAWSPLVFEDLKWVMVSEMNVSEVLNPLDASGAEFYKDFSELNEYYDLFLIHPDGEIFYTAAREADYQTNILNPFDRFADSSLGRVVRQALLSPEDEVFADFQPYGPKGNIPAAFISRPIRYDASRENSANQGLSFGIQIVVALQLSDSTLNEVMLQRTGLGETGESYLVGPDFKLRTSTRDPNRNLITSFSGDVALNGADTKPVQLALEGQSDTGLYQNYNGDWVLASFSPIEAHDQTWALITEIQASEVLRPVWILGLVVLLLLLGVVALVVQLALFFSRNITQPVSETALALQTIAEEQDLTVQVGVEQQDEIGQMAESMRQMVSQLNSALQHVEWSSRQVQQESSVLESTGRQLAEQSSSQAASLEEISSSMLELNAQTKHNHE